MFLDGKKKAPAAPTFSTAFQAPLFYKKQNWKMHILPIESLFAGHPCNELIVWIKLPTLKFTAVLHPDSASTTTPIAIITVALEKKNNHKIALSSYILQGTKGQYKSTGKNFLYFSSQLKWEYIQHEYM